MVFVASWSLFTCGVSSELIHIAFLDGGIVKLSLFTDGHLTQVGLYRYYTI